MEESKDQTCDEKQEKGQKTQKRKCKVKKTEK